MRGKRIATEGSRVQYTDGSGGQSSINMHSRADAAGVIVDTSPSNVGGWYYLSNSETSGGGVGAFRYNANGDVMNYEMILTASSFNCGGGLTWWNTWVICFKRDALEPVSGCSGLGISAKDYCVRSLLNFGWFEIGYVEDLNIPTNSPTNQPTNAPTNAPTNVCSRGID